MHTLPLLTHPFDDSIVAWRAEGPVTRREFLAEVQQLAALLPTSPYLINMCRDRYRFSVGLAAAIVSNKISLLPSTHTPETLRQMRAFAPDVFCLTDSDSRDIELPQFAYPQNISVVDTPVAVPLIPEHQCIAIVFTSGSTGTPQPHPKNWRALVASVQAEAARFAWDQDKPCHLLGTVPPQHMYGLESTVLTAWQNGHIVIHAQPFYPADICAALEAVPMPRVLVSSPLHLRALLDSQLPIPQLAGVLSATAPLDCALAHTIEARCKAPLLEIYGSTETGLIATRRPALTSHWQLLPDLRWAIDGERLRAQGGHVETLVAMSDHIEPLDETHFLLHGRSADMINIAGKRHSLDSLNHLLGSLPGVLDGAFFMPDDQGAQVTRLAAAVVAPTLDAERITAALREHLDPVFLPRPLLFVDALPRNATGKLPRAALQALFAQPGARKTA